jgi:hypothetical protein
MRIEVEMHKLHCCPIKFLSTEYVKQCIPALCKKEIEFGIWRFELRFRTCHGQYSSVLCD